MKPYDLSQPLNQDVYFWPYYPPFEVKYIKRKSEHGVNAQYIQTSNHMGTHLDAPRHFVTGGMTIDEIPMDWLYGPGVIVNLSDVLDDFDVYTPEMIESRVEVREGDLLILHTGWHRYAQFGETPDEERYILRHPGAHPDMVPWLLENTTRRDSSSWPPRRSTRRRSRGSITSSCAMRTRWVPSGRSSWIRRCSRWPFGSIRRIAAHARPFG